MNDSQLVERSEITCAHRGAFTETEEDTGDRVSIPRSYTDEWHDMVALCKAQSEALEKCQRERDDALEQAARTEFDIDRCLKLVRRLSVWLHEVVAGWQCGDVATGGYTEAAMVKECDLLLADFGEAE